MLWLAPEPALLTATYPWTFDDATFSDQITYPGTGNYTTMAYDGVGRRVQILEYTSGSLTSTKNFVWSADQPCEARDGSYVVTAQYLSAGQTISGTNYFYTTDHLGSIREVTNSSGTIVYQQAFDPYGQATTIVSTTAPDFGFDSYYSHQRSGLNLTLYRAYSATLGRWLSRDPSGNLPAAGDAMPSVFPIAEVSDGPNLYAFVRNNPISKIDELGLSCDCTKAPPLPAFGPKSPCGKYGAAVFSGSSERCVCECMDGWPGADAIRGCLACGRDAGMSSWDRHVQCVPLHPEAWPAIGVCAVRCKVQPPARPVRVGHPPIPFPI